MGDLVAGDRLEPVGYLCSDPQFATDQAGLVGHKGTDFSDRVEPRRLCANCEPVYKIVSGETRSAAAVRLGETVRGFLTGSAPTSLEMLRAALAEWDAAP